MGSEGTVGRIEAQTRLRTAANSAELGQGRLTLLSGEAGIGKTRLADDVLGSSDLRAIRVVATPSGSPYGPIVAALRVYLRDVPGGLNDCGPLRGQLATLLPELGSPDPVDSSDDLAEALRCALLAVAADRPTAILLDDLHWSDHATLDFLLQLAPTLSKAALLVVGAFRSDELARSHPMRQLRTDLRRAGAFDEVVLEPLNQRDSRELIESVVGQSISPQLADQLFSRCGGNPFFLVELTLALGDSDRLVEAPDGLKLALDEDVPLPSSIRDAVLVRIASLSEAARAASEAAAVLGNRMDLEVLGALGGPQGTSELLAAGLLAELADGWAEFRHPLEREAIYESIPWLRRSALHGDAARALSERGQDAAVIAGHWLEAREPELALDALLIAIDERAAIQAHRDAAELGRQALDIWPDGTRQELRIEVLETYAAHSELAGAFAEAIRAQREVISARRLAGSGRALADAERRIAGIFALQGDRPRALAARQVAAEAYAANSLPGEAALERLVIAGYLQSAGEHREAARVAGLARAESEQAGLVGTAARAMGLEGVATVKAGDFDDGIAIIHEGLSLALEHQLTIETAEVYQRLGTAREVAGDYEGAADALGFALGICASGDDPALEQVCVSCMAYVLRELGQWDDVDRICRELIAGSTSAQESLVADGVLGAVEAWRGQYDSALERLTRCLETATRINVVSMRCDSAAALAWLFAQQGDVERAAEHCEILLDCWEQSEDHHYAVWGLRWACGWFAGQGRLESARACADALSSIVASAGYPDALAALASALGETAAADGDLETAAGQFVRAADQHEGLNIPFERANLNFRAGVALAATGERELAIGHFGEAHKVASSLGAVPLAGEAASAIVELGGSLEDHLGARAADAHERAGLSRREHEVVKLVAEGLTNREIASRLILSTRTIDAHVRSIFTKLDCKTRTEAAARAFAAGLLDEVGNTAQSG